MKMYQPLLKIFSLILLLSSCQKEEIVKQNIPTLDISQAATGTNRNLKYGKMTDIDGNTYRTIQIGKQIWMADNLKVTRYRNGDIIEELAYGPSWANTKSGAWCNYDNSLINGNKYGKLYNWYAVKDLRDLAPKGWHIPTELEWTSLITFLGGELYAGGIMKSLTNDWLAPNTGASNQSGFSALPGGLRNNVETFTSFGNGGYWWSSTEYNSLSSYCHAIYYNYTNIFTYNDGWRNMGFSVRCVKD